MGVATTILGNIKQKIKKKQREGNLEIALCQPPFASMRKVRNNRPSIVQNLPEMAEVYVQH